ncbi:MAG: hypothetical protein ACJASR_002152, partial [Psychroserpens sp.]
MKYTNREIEEKANSLLNDVLLEICAHNNKEALKHPSKLSQEIGIDYFFEILDRTSGKSQVVQCICGWCFATIKESK